MIDLIGRFHPVLVHLPIGIFTLVLFMEAIASAERFKFLLASLKFMLLAGIITAILSLVTGYCLSLEGSNNEDRVSNHQWTAIATTLLFVLYLLFREKLLIRRYVQFLSLALLLSMLVWTGHQGGALTHGEDFLTAGLLQPSQPSNDALSFTDINRAVVYKDIVQYTLNQKCVQCHGAEKQKGKLRLDAQEWIAAGGKSGKIINTSEPRKSELIRRILLDDIDEHHMPPKEKEQLTDAEKEIFRWWINTGASYAKSVVALKPDERIIKSLNSFKENNSSESKDVFKQRPAVEPIDQATKLVLEKMGWVLSPVSKNDNHLRLTAYNLEVPFKEAFEPLSRIEENIVELKLSFTKATDVDLKRLEKLKNVEKLWLDHTDITDLTIQQLLAMKQLEYLNIVSTNVTAAGTRQLFKLANLKQLYLQGTKITPQDRLDIERTGNSIKMNFGDSMKPATTDTIFQKKTG